jgi:hypothetical protein
VILQVDCAYQDHETGDLCSNGIMVKLQISNTRNTFALEQASLMEVEMPSTTASSSSLPRRPSRKVRSQVTPSPEPIMVAASNDMKTMNMNTNEEEHCLRNDDDDDDDDDTGPLKTRSKRTSKRPAVAVVVAAAKEKARRARVSNQVQRNRRL